VLSLRGADAGDSVDPKADELRLARDEARKAKDWAASDRLRDELVALGYEVKDTAQGTVVTRRVRL
jgi:cysteinyl-tRNA synthetase